MPWFVKRRGTLERQAQAGIELTIVGQSTQVGKGNQHVQHTDKFSKFVQASHVFTDFTQKFRYHPANVLKIKKLLAGR